MSTLSMHSPRIPSECDVDARFDALVRSADPARRSAEPAAAFDTVFDLDYGQPRVLPAARRAAPADRRVRGGARPRQVARRGVTTRTVTGRTDPRRSVPPGPVPPRTVRITRRGRIVLVVAFVGIALAVMTAMGGWATATLDGGTPAPVRVVEVGPGDTLYDIAADLAKPGEIRSMVLRIQELNSLPGAHITEGQKLAVPRG